MSSFGTRTHTEPQKNVIQFRNAHPDETVDISTDDPHDEEMTSVSKEVLDARLETIETRMDGRIATMEAKIDGKFADLKSDMHKGFADMTKWIVGTIIAVAAASVTIMTFVLNNATPKAAPVTPAASAIYYVQPPTSVAAQAATSSPPAPAAAAPARTH